MNDLIIIGGGGHGREVFALIHDGLHFDHLDRTARLDVLGFVDDGAPDLGLLARLGVPHLGGSEVLPDHVGARFTVGIGSGRPRLLLADRACRAGLMPLSLVSRMAHVGPDVRLGDGCVLFPLATVTTNIDLGEQVHVGRGAAVGHDSVLGAGVTVMPNASVSGNVTVGERSTIGTGAAVIQGVTIGKDVMVGAGAVVVRDVPDGVTVVGSPARPLPAR